MDLADLAAATSTIYPTQRAPTAPLNLGLQGQSGLPGRSRHATQDDSHGNCGIRWQDLLTQGAGSQMLPGMPQRQLAEAVSGSDLPKVLPRSCTTQSRVYAGVGDVVTVVEALGVDPEQHFDAVPGALGDPRRGHPGT
jgi:hypothetical protein